MLCFLLNLVIFLWSVQYLQDAGLYESQEEAVSREEVLGRLDQVGSPLVVALRSIKEETSDSKWFEMLN